MSLIELARDGWTAPRTWLRSASDFRAPMREPHSQAVWDQKRELATAASQIAWSGNRERAQAATAVLMLGGSLSVTVLLNAVGEFPRSDIQEEAASILARLAGEESSCSALLESARSTELNAPARATAARALGAADLSGEFLVQATQALVALLSDASAEVRDATVAALSDRGGADAKRALQNALARENAPFIRDAIAKAIEEC